MSFDNFSVEATEEEQQELNSRLHSGEGNWLDETTCELDGKTGVCGEDGSMEWRH